MCTLEQFNNDGNAEKIVNNFEIHITDMFET